VGGYSSFNKNGIIYYTLFSLFSYSTLLCQNPFNGSIISHGMKVSTLLGHSLLVDSHLLSIVDNKYILTKDHFLTRQNAKCEDQPSEGPHDELIQHIIL
jgi:hypothetical protein